jgi:peptidoglycan/LPS O-acetylase OafA/YrhL
MRNAPIASREVRRRIDSLDGLRALAVLLVFATHTGAGFAKGGWFGVDIFFVLSGYLITSILLREHDETGTVNVNFFYLRRALRLIPALVVVVVIVTPFNVTVGHGDFGDSVASLFYYADFWETKHGGQLLGHTWSLAVEEQFYLIWPFLLTSALRRPKLWPLILVVTAVVVAAATHLGFSHLGTNAVYYLPTTYIPVLAVGAAVAFAFRNPKISEMLTAVTASPALPIAALVGIGVILFSADRYSTWSFKGPLILLALLPAVIICNLITNPDGVVSRAFGARSLVWLGRRSYGFYLWHFPISYFLFERGYDPLAITAICLPSSLALTVLSWNLVERPFLALKNRRFEPTPQQIALAPISEADQRRLGAVDRDGARPHDSKILRETVTLAVPDRRFPGSFLSGDADVYGDSSDELKPERPINDIRIGSYADLRSTSIDNPSTREKVVAGSSKGGPNRLARRLAARDDNFDVLRLGAAAMVLVSHAFPLAGHHEPGLLGTSDTLGFVGVLIFFSISGFLITQSWVSDPDPLHYIIKRALRILPGLLISLFLTAYVLGPIVTTMPVRSYISSLTPIKYVIGNTVMATNYALPGVFHTNPSATVNGSLGTLPVEVKAYIMLALLGLVAASRGKVAKVGLSVLFVGVLVVSFKTGVKPFWSLLDLFCLFAGAAGLFLTRERLQLNLVAFAAAVLIWIASYKLPLGFHAVLMGISLPYAVIYLAFRGLDSFRWLTRLGDVSYGLYVYAFPVTQTVVYAGVTAPTEIILIAFPVTYMLALLSWKLVEQPALRQKRRLTVARATR